MLFVEATYFRESEGVVKNAVQLVRFTLVEANVNPWREHRDKYERRATRESPQKIKIITVFAC